MSYSKIEGARKSGPDTYASIKCREMRERKRQYIYEKLGYCCCKVCGSKENLEFDYIKPSLKTTNKFLPTLGFDRLDAELYNIQLLCRVCHRKRSDAQQDAAWELFSNLPTEDQEKLTQSHLEKKRKVSRGSSKYKGDMESR